MHPGRGLRRSVLDKQEGFDFRVPCEYAHDFLGGFTERLYIDGNAELARIRSEREKRPRVTLCAGLIRRRSDIPHEAVSRRVIRHVKSHGF
jgi:hypothetical protein